MTIAYVRDSGKSTQNNLAPNTVAWTWGTPPTQGNAVISLLANFHSGTSPSLSTLVDNGSPTPSGNHVIDKQGNTTNSFVAITRSYYVNTASPYTETATVVQTAGNYYVVGGVEFSGLGGFITSGFNGQAAVSTSISVSTSGSVASGQDLLVAVCTVEASGALTLNIPADWTLLWRETDGVNGVVAVACYKIGTVGTPLSGVQSINFTWTGNNGARLAAIACYTPLPVIASKSVTDVSTTSYTGFSLQAGASPAIAVDDVFFTDLTTSPSLYNITVNRDGTVVIPTGGDTSRQSFLYSAYRRGTNTLDSNAVIWVNETAPIWGSSVFLNNQSIGIGIPTYNLAATPFAVSPSGDTMTFALISGSLPPGVSLSSSGILSGVTTIAGNYTFTISATDLTNTASNSPLNQIVVLAIVIIPNVVGLSIAAANTALIAANLVQGSITAVYSATIPAGNVITQFPSAGTSANAGTSVDLIESLGPDPFIYIDDAIFAAVNAGLVVTQPIQVAYSPTVPIGHVISQTPASGTAVPYSTPVYFVVSKGPAPVVSSVTVPNVIGNIISDAKLAITNAGCGNVNPIWQTSSSIPGDTVISQSVAGGTPVVYGTSVQLTVSSGPTVTTFPGFTVVVPLMH